MPKDQSMFFSILNSFDIQQSKVKIWYNKIEVLKNLMQSKPGTIEETTIFLNFTKV